ncbi:hypothetical protein [Streptomyces diastatochromogenes]|uniref:Uncharacterized protein n=1 Tax=Streptomyces diastatochromogenes TaxID=42236 RepID=A0A233S062_STRDA|nr:hypothetical protein [Streptomyces diastatochromogenes]MCZ0990825.1 hypothetical protein [Streptomyces diastatochromogenes]OXY89013.1 hypothetical protein BEK98_40075 [Streptomyces diastatochromogenes]
MVSSLIVLTLRPVLYGTVVYAVRRREALAPLPVPPPPQELAAALVNLLLGKGAVTPQTREKSLTWTLRIAAGLAWVGVLYACSGFDPVVFDVVFKATVLPSVLLLLWFQWFPRRSR